MIMSDSDHKILSVLCKNYRFRGLGNKAALNALTKKLQKAFIVSSEDVPPDVVKINSLLRVTELGSGYKFICSVVLPWEASIENKRLSVLSGTGVAMLGESVGQIVMCRGRTRLLLIVIEELIEQRSTVPRLVSPLHR
jgi:regulator of nucleoside diphosphate kinase